MNHSEVGAERMGRREALRLKVFAIIMALVLCFGWPNEIAAYAVLAHEAIIDSVWNTNRDWASVQAELEQLKKSAPSVVPTAVDVPAQPGLSAK